jgi:hypothetical protein
MINTYKILARNPEGKRSFMIPKKDIIKLIVMKYGVERVQGRFKLETTMKTAINVPVP